MRCRIGHVTGTRNESRSPYFGARSTVGPPLGLARAPKRGWRKWSCQFPGKLQPGLVAVWPIVSTKDYIYIYLNTKKPWRFGRSFFFLNG